MRAQDDDRLLGERMSHLKYGMVDIKHFVSSGLELKDGGRAPIHQVKLERDALVHASRLPALAWLNIHLTSRKSVFIGSVDEEHISYSIITTTQSQCHTLYRPLQSTQPLRRTRMLFFPMHRRQKPVKQPRE